MRNQTPAWCTFRSTGSSTRGLLAAYGWLTNWSASSLCGTRRCCDVYSKRERMLAVHLRPCAATLSCCGVHRLQRCPQLCHHNLSRRRSCARTQSSRRKSARKCLPQRCERDRESRSTARMHPRTAVSMLQRKRERVSEDEKMDGNVSSTYQQGVRSYVRTCHLLLALHVAHTYIHTHV